VKRQLIKTMSIVSLGALVVTGVVGCGGSNSDLKQMIAEKKKRPGSHIAPLQPIKTYESFTYDPTGLRSPFVASTPASSGGGIRPDAHRNRQYLETYSLDTLKMVGTLRQAGQTFGLIQTKDGLVHRVQTGNYVGQNDGKIQTITDSKITVVEIVPDGMGAYVERPATLALATH